MLQVHPSRHSVNRSGIGKEPTFCLESKANCLHVRTALSKHVICTAQPLPPPPTFPPSFPPYFSCPSLPARGGGMPHPAQPQHTNHWAPRTWKRHQQEHRPQRSTESSDPTQHVKGGTGDCPGPRKETTSRRNVPRGGGGGWGGDS